MDLDVVFLGTAASVPSAGRGLSSMLIRRGDRKSTRLNSSHANISYAVFCLKKSKIFVRAPARTHCRTTAGLLRSLEATVAHRHVCRLSGVAAARLRAGGCGQGCVSTAGADD